MTRASVCIATYNGETFLAEQLDSIMSQIGEFDEIIIVDDASEDRTREILRGYKDHRINIHLNEKNLGACASFERAIHLAKGRNIILSDQDDVWVEGRIEKMCSALESNLGLVSSNFSHINQNGEALVVSVLPSLKASQSSNYITNIVKLFFGRMQYFGSAMAFSAQLKGILLPFPQYVEAHDHWIAVAANLSRQNHHLEDITLKRRIHGNNLSHANRKLSEKLYSRFIFIRQTLELLRRIINLSRLNLK